MFEMLDHNGPGHFGSSFALGFSEPNFVEKPTHPHQGRGSWRPNPRMRSQTSSVAKLHKPLAAILVGKEILWAAQAALGASGYVTVEDQGDHRRARRARRRRPWRSCVTGASWRMLTWPFMEPRSRWSSKHLKKQWRLIAKGELGYIPAKHIVSALPEEGERPSSTHKKIIGGRLGQGG